MCGIVGYIGNEEAKAIIIDGLRRLEYRGYDSAGIALVIDGKIDTRKHVGGIDNLERLIGEKSFHADEVEPLRDALRDAAAELARVPASKLWTGTQFYSHADLDRNWSPHVWFDPAL